VRDIAVWAGCVGAELVDADDGGKVVFFEGIGGAAGAGCTLNLII